MFQQPRFFHTTGPALIKPDTRGPPTKSPPMSTSEGVLKTPDGLELYTKTWHAGTSPAKARLAFIHGFSDHCNFYGGLFPALADAGITVHALDQRGWGRSVRAPAQKGLTGPTTQVMADLTTFLESLLADDDAAAPPLFLMGHSMGGQEVLYYSATGPAAVVGRLRGVLAESPFVALHPSARPWSAVVAVGRAAGRLLPRLQLVQKLDSTKLCRDPEVCRAMEADPLCHDTGTLEGLAGMLDRAGALEEGRVLVRDGVGEGGRLRIWIGHGSEDGICDFEAARRWFDGVRVEDKEFKRYEGGYHKLHAEPNGDGEEFAQDVARWVLDRAGEAAEGGGKARL